MKRTLEKVRQRFFWPNCKSDITRWCRKCETCAQTKPGPRHKALLGANTVRRKLEVVYLDVLGELPVTSAGNRYILVATDAYTKWTHAMAMPDQSAQTIADVFSTEFICYFGCPIRIHSDQGRQFEGNLFKELCTLLGVDKSRTCGYHPQGNGQVERHNRTLQQMLLGYVNDHRDDWDEHLPYLNMAYRATPHESTHCSPNLMMFGEENKLGIDAMVGLPPGADEYKCETEYIQWLRNTLESVHNYADKQLASSAKRRKDYYNLTAKPIRYKSGQFCWRWYPPAAKGKLGKGWCGPVRIQSVPTDHNCVVKLDPELSDSRDVRVHVNSLKPYELPGDVPEKWQAYEEALRDANGVVECEVSESDPVHPPMGSGTPVNSEDGGVDMEVQNDVVSSTSDTESEGCLLYGRGHRRRHAPQRYSPE